MRFVADNLRASPLREDYAPFIACVLDVGRAQDRLAQRYGPPPINPRPHPRPDKRRRSPRRDYGLTVAELPEWRSLLTRGFSAIEAANVVIRSRRTVRP